MNPGGGGGLAMDPAGGRVATLDQTGVGAARKKQCRTEERVAPGGGSSAGGGGGSGAGARGKADSERRKGGGYGRWRDGCWPAAERDEQICGGQWEEDEM